MADFISDEDMAKLESPAVSSPDFISDEEMNKAAPVEQTEAPKFSPETSEALAKVREESAPVANTYAGALAGYGTGLAIQKGGELAAQAGNKFVERLGVLKPEQLKTITERSSEYKKTRDFPALMEEFKSLAAANRQRSFNFAEQAKESLKGLPDVKGSDVIKAISNIQSVPLMEIPEADLPQPKTSTAGVSRLEALNTQKKALEAELAQRAAAGIESPAFNKEVEALQSQLSKVDKGIASANQQTLKELASPIKPTLADFSKVTGIPVEVLQQNPALMSKKVQPAVASALKQEVDFLKTGTIPAYDVGKKYIPSLQDKAGYSAIPDEAAKFKQEVARNVSEFIKEQPGAEEYKKGQALSQQAIKIEDQLKDFGISFGKKTGEMKVTNKNKIANLYKNGDSSEILRLEKLIQQAQDLGLNAESGIDAGKLKSIDRFQSELPLASIKGIVENTPEDYAGRIRKSVVAGGIGTLVGGPVVGGAAATAAATAPGLPTGTKLQEQIALLKGTGAYKGLGKVAKAGLSAAPSILGATGAIIGGLSAAQAGELSPAAAAATTLADIAVPLPVDVTAGAVEAKKGYRQNIEEQKMTPEYFAEGGEVSQLPAVLAGAKTGAKALLSPIPTLAKAAKSQLEEFGNERSASARERMEQQMKALESLKKPKLEEPPKQDFLDFVDKNPEALQKLAETLSPSQSSYAGPLLKASQADGRSRAAILYGLYQQPEFRSIIGESSMINKNIPGVKKV